MDPGLIYILSDDPTVREVLVALLEEAGYAPVCFADGKALLAGARRRCPACVLLEIPVPEQGGFHVLDELKGKAGSPTPVIVISSNGNAEVAFQAGMMGATDFIERPFTDRDLIRRVKRATTSRSRRREFAIGLNSFCRSGLLTERQHQILDLMLSGKSTKDIAFCLGLSPRTVEDHRANILGRAKVKSIVQLLAVIHESGRSSMIEMPPVGTPNRKLQGDAPAPASWS